MLYNYYKLQCILLLKFNNNVFFLTVISNFITYYFKYVFKCLYLLIYKNIIGNPLIFFLLLSKCQYTLTVLSKNKL